MITGIYGVAITSNYVIEDYDTSEDLNCKVRYEFDVVVTNDKKC